MISPLIRPTFRCALSIALILTSLGVGSGAPRSVEKSKVIVSAIIIDGSGRPGFRANVRIVRDRIAKVGRFAPRADEEIIQARGMIIAPGFIDIHNHSQEGLEREPVATNQVSQGLTTLALGPDGGSPWPVAEYLKKREEQKIAVNVLSFIGHATVRQQVMGKDYDRAATREEISKMAALVDQAMREGAFGLSSGLEYDVGRGATTEELIELARAASRQSGIYMTHMRDEEEGMLDALAEAIRVGREARLPVQISHIKMGNRNVWGQAHKAIALVNRAHGAGLDVTADCYPYTAWASTITVLVSNRHHEDKQEVEKDLQNVGGASHVLVTNCRAHPEFEFKNLEEIATLTNTTAVEAYQRIVHDGGASVVCSSMNEADMGAFYVQRWVMVASDGGIGSRHPRGSGTFPRVLGRFVREQHWLTLPAAVRKMTSLPAKRLGLTDRGLIREGMKADLVIFDPKRVIDRSTFKEPQLLSEGIERVLVNGEAVWEGGKTTGRLPGEVIRKQVGPSKP
ncbi:MAG TPA: D-aminoacylase [Blastocatellia bacterium]|nr:D-aminoacylase [Blastocatellia bacterium]